MKYKDYLITALSYARKPEKRKLIRTAFNFRSKNGIEIGGPSVIFGLRGAFPIYLFAENIDGVNFSDETVWEGRIQEGETYNYYPGKIGRQYIAEATELSTVPSEHYDFLLSCHSLEHVANPLKAVFEWKRVLKKDGSLVLVLPDKRNSFDRGRPYTSIEHLVTDYQENRDEHDQTHFEEILQHYDPATDPAHKSKDQVAEILRQNFTNRLAHHHVFSQDVVKKMLEYCGFRTEEQYEIAPFHLFTIAKKLD